MSQSSGSRPSRFSARTAGADASPAPTYCFSVQAAAEPGVMPRVLELFAKRNLVPSKWHSAVVGAAGDELQIDIQVVGLKPELGDYIAQCLRQIMPVACVLTTMKAVEAVQEGRRYDRTA